MALLRGKHLVGLEVLQKEALGYLPCSRCFVQIVFDLVFELCQQASDFMFLKIVLEMGICPLNFGFSKGTKW